MLQPKLTELKLLFLVTEPLVVIPEAPVMKEPYLGFILQLNLI